MHPYKRSTRVGKQLTREVADIIYNRLKDPRIGFVTVTDVSVTSDLKLARIYVSILRPEEVAESLEALDAAKPFIRTEIGHRLRMKFTPAIEFHLDTAPAYADKIDRLLKGIDVPHDPDEDTRGMTVSHKEDDEDIDEEDEEDAEE